MKEGAQLICIPVQLKEGARLPAQRKGDVGFDLYASESVILSPGKVTKVPTGVVMAGPMAITFDMPKGATHFYKIEGRSSMALQGAFPVGGIIDASYRGEIIGLIANMNDFSVEIKAGEKFAQLVCYSVFANTESTEVQFSEAAEVQQTERGTGGFGSTGK